MRPISTPQNRWKRRVQHRTIPPARNNQPYSYFIRRGLTPTQFLERRVQISGRGRVCEYRMRYWGKTRKGKAAPLGTGHENWHDPFARVRMGGGVWCVHLWPN
ncbi:MAG TPA: hypothetical protein ENJ42_02625 [Hellea balneolensis]|uniref:Uncharacterized protein n=1 Tax=Hellea balneolensis TaxID=287478 RepID=A0A7C5LZF6_9PROT|nr:hypothetical protein [Hellea balneolensis]